MNIVRYAGFTLKSAALWVALAFAVLFLVLAAFCLLAVALFVTIDQHWGTAAAAALTGLALLLIAGLVLVAGAMTLGRVRRRTPHPFGEASSTVAMLMSFANILVRRDPKRALLLALIAGAVTEYLTRVE